MPLHGFFEMFLPWMIPHVTGWNEPEHDTRVDILVSCVLGVELSSALDAVMMCMELNGDCNRMHYVG